MGWKSVLSLVLALPLSGLVLAQSSPTEQFDEELIVRPLRDGRVASRFSFTTLLKGAEPRDPQRLGSDDDCAL
jgi:phosphatidylinositol glycan class T